MEKELLHSLLCEADPPLGVKWYDPVIFHPPHSPPMWVWLNVNAKKEELNSSPSHVLWVCKTNQKIAFSDLGEMRFSSVTCLMSDQHRHTSIVSRVCQFSYSDSVSVIRFIVCKERTVCF